MGRYAEDIGVGIIAGVMAGLGAVVVGVLGAVLVSQAHGGTLYPGQFAQYSPEQRSWFKELKSPGKVPCCDVADGRRSDWKSGESETGYLAMIVNPDASVEWVPVPKAALIEPNMSPDRQTWVWYTSQNQYTDEDGTVHRKFYIRCFVVGDEG